jgi:hypothetical protein
MSNEEESIRDKYFDASAEAAAVRCTVISLPSMTASGLPESPSNKKYVAITDGRDLLTLSG